MKRLAAALAALCLACQTSNSGSEPDPHLGTLFVQFKDVNADPGEGSVKFINGVFNTDSVGTVHMVGTLKPSREFGTSNVHFNRARYWRITRGGAVEEKEGPSYSAATVTNAHLSLRIGVDDDQPVLVQTAGLAAGKLASFYAFDGAAWNEKAFFLSHRPEGVSSLALGPEDQVRALGNHQYLIQLKNRLLRSTESGWVELPLPPRALSVRLVNADQTSLRVVWLEPGDRLAAGTYSRDTWTLNPTVTRAHLSFAATDFGASFSDSGAVNAFVVDVSLSLSSGVAATYRFADDTFTRTDDGMGTARAPLMLLRHPTRALRGLTMGVFLGRDTGLVSALAPGLTQVNCPVVDAGTVVSTENNPLGRDLSSPFPDSPEARRCSPRRVDVQMVPEPDLSGMVLVTIDRTQDAVTRGYVKRVPFPLGGDPFYGAADAGPGGFPGDDGSTDLDPNQPKIEGHAYLVGRGDQSDITVTITNLLTGVKETSNAGADGRFRSLPLQPGDYSVELAGPAGYETRTFSATVTATSKTQVGAHVLDAETGIFPASYRLGAQLLGFDSAFNSYQLSGAVIERGNAGGLTASFTTLTSAASPSPAPLFLAELATANSVLGWQEGANTTYSVSGAQGTYTGSSLHDYRLVGRNVPAVASGPVDGVTPRDWKWNGDVPVATGAVEVAFSSSGSSCLGMALWVPEDGGLSAKWSPQCGPGTPQVLTGEAPRPPLTLEPADVAITVFEGRNCGKASGFLNPCPLFSIFNGESMKVSASAVEVRGRLFLERTGNIGTLKHHAVSSPTPTTLATNLQLPASYANDEHTFYPLSADAVLIRTATGFTFKYLQNAPVMISANVVQSWSLQNDVVMVSSSGTDCSTGCSIEGLTASGGTLIRVPLMTGATGSEQVGVIAGTGFTTLSEQPWPECPGGPCSVMVRADLLTGPRVVTRGSLIAYPRDTAYRPLLFSRVNQDGGMPVPSTIR